MPGLIIANLDAEARWAGVVLPLRVRRAISAVGTLVAAAFGDEGTELWTPEPVARSRIPAIPGAFRPSLRSGPLPSDAGDRGLLWWCQLDEVARRVNHRGFGFGLAQRRGLAHAGAALVANLDELDAHLEAWRPTGTWVLKAPLSASGRDRLRHRGHPLSGEHRAYARRLLARSDRCLVEPWVDRTADLGMTERGAHRLEVDPAGVFRGIGLGVSVREPALDAAYAAARAALTEAGYRGPAGIDAYRWRDDAGIERLHAISEINARYTFAHVAHALAARLRSALGHGPGPAVLRIAAARAERPRETQACTVSLLAPGDGDPTTAWLELPDVASASAAC